MSYLDLPQDWMGHPLDDPELSRDVADFLLSDHDRMTNTLLLVRCRNDSRLAKRPIMISHMNWQASALKRRRCLERFFRPQPEGMIVGLSAAQRLPRAAELAWAITIEDLCTSYRVNLFGLHSLCREGSFDIEPPRPLPEVGQIRRAMLTA